MIEKLIRQHLKSFQPYVSARSEVQSGQIMLDANELSLGSPVSYDGIALNRYPDPFQLQLRKKVAEKVGTLPEMIFAGVGSDEVIDLLIRMYCEPVKDSITIFEPTYGMYRVAANLNAVSQHSIELNADFQIPQNYALNLVDSSTKIVFLCSPNNPTGNLLKRSDILWLCKNLNAIVVVDQAYVEFADASGDLAKDVIDNQNLVILRTLSKAWGLAGIRLGYCIANPIIVRYLLRFKAPYTINSVTSRLAFDALKNSHFLTQSIQSIVQERNRLIERLKTVTGVVRVCPSDANFILVEFTNALKVYEVLFQKGIIVRRRSEPRLTNCLRITVGTPDENDRLLTTLSEQE